MESILEQTAKIIRGETAFLGKGNQGKILAVMLVDVGAAGLNDFLIPFIPARFHCRDELLYRFRHRPPQDAEPPRMLNLFPHAGNQGRVTVFGQQILANFDERSGVRFPRMFSATALALERSAFFTASRRSASSEDLIENPWPARD
jgi:hypothetical protein